jgi:diguanylate cyclase (GGDEF)-like protein
MGGLAGMDMILNYLLGAATFVPHGYCLLWRPDLVAMHAGSDALIALAYFTIPAAIFVFARRRRDIAHPQVAGLFILFILLCGLTHVVGVWSLWQPVYGLQALLKLLTAAVSIGTAIALWPLMPKLLALPSPALLAEKAHRLEQEVLRREGVEAALRRAHDDLERRVEERTRALAIAKAEAEHLAYHDGLTQLANRRLLERRLQEVATGGRADRAGFAVVVIDLDDFKSVNDGHGHAVGDALLVETATRLRHCVRSQDLVARLGGDEFAIVAAGYTDRRRAEQLGRRLIDALAASFRVGTARLRPSASVGIALNVPGIDTAAGVLGRADRAAYAAKQAGGGTWRLSGDRLVGAARPAIA